MATPGPRRGFLAVPFCLQNGCASNAKGHPRPSRGPLLHIVLQCDNPNGVSIHHQLLSFTESKEVSFTPSLCLQSEREKSVEVSFTLSLFSFCMQNDGNFTNVIDDNNSSLHRFAIILHAK